jgi:hypothetical protein
MFAQHFSGLRHPCWNVFISRNALASGSEVFREPDASAFRLMGSIQLG